MPRLFRTLSPTLLTLAIFVSLVTISQAQHQISWSLELVSQNQTTTPFVYDGAFDVYNLVATNGFGVDATSLDLEIVGNFITTGGRTVKPGADLPVIFGQIVPDSFFVVPESVASDQILIAPGTTIDTTTTLAAEFTVSGDTALIPGDGTPTVIATFSAPAGTLLGLPLCLGRAAVGGRFVSIGCLLNDPPCPRVPEPTAVTIGLLSLAAFLPRARR